MSLDENAGPNHARVSIDIFLFAQTLNAFFSLKKTAPATVSKNGLNINMYLYLHEESM